MTWRQRIEFYVAEGRAVEPERVTVSKNVFDKAQTHQLRVIRSNPDHTIGEVTSATSGSTYWTELWVDYDNFYPSFPFVWKCDCVWAGYHHKSQQFGIALPRHGQLSGGSAALPTGAGDL